MTPALDGHVAVVTGAGSGIGRATAIRLAECGASVVLAARRGRELAEVARVIADRTGRPNRAAVFPVDVRDEGNVAALARHVINVYGRIDILVSSAGLGRGPETAGPVGRPVSQLTTSEWDLVLDTNLRGAFLVNRAVLPSMISRRSGHIINISSARGGVRGQPFGAPYSASKFALAGMTESLAEEVCGYGIHAHVIFPDVTDTPMLQTTTLSGRLGPLLTPERVAEFILSLIGSPPDVVFQRPMLAPFPLPARRNETICQALNR